MPEERGVIRNKLRGKQLNSFKGMVRERNITPTDIDGFIDYGGRAFVYLEGKLENAEFICGQKQALMAAVRSHWQASHPTMALLYEHNIPSSEEIPVGWQVVKGVFCVKQIPNLMRVPYENGVPIYKVSEHWFHTQERTTVLEALEIFEKHFRVF